MSKNKSDIIKLSLGTFALLTSFVGVNTENNNHSVLKSNINDISLTEEQNKEIALLKKEHLASVKGWRTRDRDKAPSGCFSSRST